MTSLTFIDVIVGGVGFGGGGVRDYGSDVGGGGVFFTILLMEL